LSKQANDLHVYITKINKWIMDALCLKDHTRLSYKTQTTINPKCSDKLLCRWTSQSFPVHWKTVKPISQHYSSMSSFLTYLTLNSSHDLISIVKHTQLSLQLTVTCYLVSGKPMHNAAVLATCCHLVHNIIHKTVITSLQCLWLVIWCVTSLFSTNIWLYQGRKVKGGELSLPSIGRLAIY